MKKALVVGAALGVASSADAAVFNVSTNGDNGAGSLRQAVADANTNAGPDTITFNAALSGSTITLTTGEMLISDSVDIQGLGSASLTVDADTNSRVFYVYNPSPAPIDVTISGLTLANGLSVVAGDPPASSGGAVRAVGENLSLDDVDIENSTAGGDGGGLAFFGIDSTSSYNPVSAVLSIQSSVISGNAADYVDLGVPVDQGGCGGGIWAGGIYNVLLDGVTLANNGARCDGGGFHATYFQDGGVVTIQNSVVTGNTAGLGEGGAGGGVSFGNYSYGYSASASINDTTIAGNDAGYGGGVFTFYVGDLTIARTTISGNTAADGGAGVMSVYSRATLENSTVAENATEGYGGGVYAYSSEMTVNETTVSGNTATGDGPGIYAYSETSVGITNSIVANNTPGADLVDDGSAGFAVAYSLVENQGVANVTDSGGNVFGVDPQLGPLQNNGGPTLTMEPAPASPAVNAGDPAFAPPPATDQRGLVRVSGGRIDMGSVELNLAVSAADLSITKVLQPGPVTQGGNVTFTLTVTNSGPDAAANVVVSDTLPAQLTFVSATPSTGSCSGTVTVTCNLGTLNPSASATITLVATMTGSGPATNIATVVADTADGDSSDNSSQVTFTILPAQFAGVPALDVRMQLLLAALIAAAALGVMKRT